MSKLACACGFVIDDDDSAIGGAILKDEEQDALWAEIETGIGDFLIASKSGRRGEWLRRHFADPYPSDTDDASALSDFIHMTVYGASLAVNECRKCGRIHVQDPPATRRVRSFSPDDEGYAALLRSTRSGAG